jgi:hypothetical protein
MSAQARTKVFWSIPIVVLASWLAVRAIAASPVPTTPTAIAVIDPEIGDPSLRSMIGRFAEAARARAGVNP